MEIPKLGEPGAAAHGDACLLRGTLRKGGCADGAHRWAAPNALPRTQCRRQLGHARRVGAGRREPRGRGGAGRTREHGTCAWTGGRGAALAPTEPAIRAAAALSDVTLSANLPAAESADLAPADLPAIVLAAALAKEGQATLFASALSTALLPAAHAIGRCSPGGRTGGGPGPARRGPIPADGG